MRPIETYDRLQIARRNEGALINFDIYNFEIFIQHAEVSLTKKKLIDD